MSQQANAGPAVRRPGAATLSTIEQALQPLRWLTGEEQRTISAALASPEANTLGGAVRAAHGRCAAWQPPGATPPAKQLVAAALLHAAQAVPFEGDRAEAWRPVTTVLELPKASASARLIAGMLYGPRAAAVAPDRVADLLNFSVEMARDEHSAALRCAYTALCGLGAAP